ncbi:Hypothetical predicted protein [Lecanosticta acicola]|uniref:Uncharacterized protein n=1 Tax=Lecanosticta acicola TaxID=111012 RepID=A0AAI8YUV4_9PEZI|nr:Hypothetical predicted protein [Lecanosticta acicola]
MDIVQQLEELSQLDSGLHWFCPRESAEDANLYFDEDLTDSLASEPAKQKEARQAKNRLANERREQALLTSKILAFDGQDAKPYQEKLIKCFAEQLTRCDICIREYHRSRAWLRAQLEEEYPEDDVREFMQKYDEMNNERIISGLATMTETLMDLPPADRKITSAGDQGMYAMFEALNCRPFINNEDLLKAWFDKPFGMVQVKKKVTIPQYAPGMVAFLFSSEQVRTSWAEKNFDKIKRPLLPNEFEFSVKPFLEPALGRVYITALEEEFLPIFWKATRRIVRGLDRSLIANNFRAMDANLYTIGLEHFQLDKPHFEDLLATYRMLLDKAPAEFWDAMGSYGAPPIINTIFAAPGLEHMLLTREERPHGQQTHIAERMEWVNAFIRSIKPSLIVAPLRIVLNQTLHKYQEEKYPHSTSSVAWEVGLSCVSYACDALKETVEGGPVYTHFLETIAKDHLGVIMQDLEGIESKGEIQVTKSQSLELQILQSALALDLKSLTRDRKMIETKRELDHEIGASSLNIWKVCMRHVKPGQPIFVIAILSGITGLLPLDTLPPKSVSVAQKAGESFNMALGRVQEYVTADFLERLDAFSPDQLVDVLADKHAARGIMSLLFSGDNAIHNGALSVLKTLSGEDGRRDSLMHVIRLFFSTVLQAAGASVRDINDARVFGPCSNMLKLLRDVFSCLCDTSDGILRSKTEFTKDDTTALRTLWMRTWTMLQTIFDNTESWSSLGHNKDDMKDFCRETMDFADFVFDQYSIIASTLQTARGDRSSVSSGKDLLQQPNNAFKSVIKWLRLRDDYLIQKAVDLTGKLLGRMREVGVEISTESAQYVEDVVATSDKQYKIKSKLDMNQKAVLQRALEQHTGKSLASTNVNTTTSRTKQSSLQGWAVPGTGHDDRSGSSTPVSGARPKNVINVDEWSKTADRQKAEGAKPMQKVPSLTQQKAAAQQQADQKNFLQKRKQALAEQQKQKQAAIEKANLGAGSGVAGIGNLGKDHSTTGQTVMIDDDELDREEEEEEEGDDDDDLDDDLFGTSSKPKKGSIPRVDVSGAVGLKPEFKGPTRIQRITRTAKDLRARVKQDLSPLYHIMLGWDYFHEGIYPPGYSESDFSQVSNSFWEHESYRQTFEPLLIMEAWSSMAQEKEQNTSKPYEIKILNRGNVDRFIEVSSMLGQQENKELGLHEGDIVLLSKSSKPASDGDSPHCLARISRIKRQKGTLEVVYQVMPGSTLAGQLTMQTIIHGLKVQSITPLEREYAALKALQFYDLNMQIVKGKPSPRLNYSDKQISQIQDVYKLNRAQCEAVNAALDNEGFSLIQGPPGTGKTGTIKAIVGGLLTQTLGSRLKGATKIAVPNANGRLNGSEDTAPKKLMVCAPSNAAIDEIVIRLKDGIKTKDGKEHKINVVRIGKSDAINAKVQDVTMDELVAKKQGSGNEKDQKAREQSSEVFRKHKEISDQLKELYNIRDAHEKGEHDMVASARKKLDDDIVLAKKEKTRLGQQIDRLKDQEREAGREQEMNTKRARQAVLDEAHVICATLSGSGHDMFSNLNIEFETVIIDEAAQCVEMSTLIPLKYGCIKCILVGDPKQLPPTIFSDQAKAFQYEQSLFVRMQKNSPNDVHLLDTQYRMHPAISAFPSTAFYDQLLKDGITAQARVRPWHASALLAPYRFFDVRGRQTKVGKSSINVDEIEHAMALYERLMIDFKHLFQFNDADGGAQIGIISTYKAQHREMKNRFIRKYGTDVEEHVEFNTTDAFQGREKEVIIFSCVRASQGIGFLKDIRRMNVGLTRAKSSLWILGSSENLSTHTYWKKMVDDARSTDRYTTGNILGMLRQPSSNFRASVTSSNTQAMLDIINHHAMLNAEAAEQNLNDYKMTDAAWERENSVGGDNKPTSATDKTMSRDSDRMDGVTVKFEDRMGRKRTASAMDLDENEASEERRRRGPGGFNGPNETPGDNVSPKTTLPPKQQSRSATPASNSGKADVENGRSAPRSRTGAPLSAGSSEQGPNGEQKHTNGEQKHANGDAGASKARAPLVQQPKSAPKKKPGPSLFMPKKPAAKR